MGSYLGLYSRGPLRNGIQDSWLSDRDFPQVRSCGAPQKPSPKAYLNPEQPTFLGFLIMISAYKSLKK